MAYNTTTDRLLNAIKTNTANISVTATVDNTSLEGKVDATNVLLDTIDTDTGNIDTKLGTIETNSNLSLGKGDNGSEIVTAADLITNANTDVIGSDGNPTASGVNTAVQFLEETIINNYQVGTATEQTGLTVTVPAGTIIYGDIRILVIQAAKNCIVYKA